MDDVLKTEFGLTEGLADASKVTLPWDTGQKDKKGKPIITMKEVHRVQILDPATGTGTFLAEVIKQIAPRLKDKAPGLWASYVEKDLIPRLHGFELLMASYAMCHLKLDMVLREYDYQPTASPPRVSVYLTNSLEEDEAANQTLPFAQWLSNEVKAANTIKRDLPIMVVIGNPPYNNSSANMGEYARRIVETYKENLDETRIHLDDDYVKFVRLAEMFIERNGLGVVGYICNNSFLDGVTHRGMRRHLLQTFSKIDIVNLHGDIRGGAGVQTGDLDKNVFDITQGVTIIICSKSSAQSQASGAVRYTELIGERTSKYEWLLANGRAEPNWVEVHPSAPYFFFVPKDPRGADTYDQGFKLSELFGTYSSGIQTKRDAVCVAFKSTEMLAIIEDFVRGDPERIRRAYSLPADGRDWSIQSAIEDVRAGDGEVVPFLYRPFDIRKTYYSGRTKGFQAYPRRAVMKHVVGKQNVVLLANRQHVKDFSYAGVTNIANCHGTFYLGNRGQDYAFPLYLYPDPSELDQTRRVNFDPTLYVKLRRLGTHPTHGEPDEIAAFDYIYGVLHCPAYRESYAEFLKFDFPRIPWPATPDVFWEVSDKGGQLRRLHLMEPASIGETPYPFVGDESEGKNTVEKLDFRDGAVWINAHQCFENSPEVSWNLSIGGYQPAWKWLNDRRGRTLDWADVQHYQRILKILAETDRIMTTIQMPLD